MVQLLSLFDDEGAEANDIRDGLHRQQTLWEMIRKEEIGIVALEEVDEDLLIWKSPQKTFCL